MDLVRIYQKLLKHFGKQYWWPADTRFEVIIGAILTQQTTWKNVESAIKNLNDEGLLNPPSLATALLDHVEALIRNTGFYRQKARRISDVSKYLVSEYNGSLDEFFNGHRSKYEENYYHWKELDQKLQIRFYCMQQRD